MSNQSGINTRQVQGRVAHLSTEKAQPRAPTQCEDVPHIMSRYRIRCQRLVYWALWCRPANGIGRTSRLNWKLHHVDERETPAYERVALKRKPHGILVSIQIAADAGSLVSLGHHRLRSRRSPRQWVDSVVADKPRRSWLLLIGKHFSSSLDPAGT